MPLKRIKVRKHRRRKPGSNKKVTVREHTRIIHGSSPFSKSDYRPSGKARSLTERYDSREERDRHAVVLEDEGYEITSKRTLPPGPSRYVLNYRRRR